MEAKPAPKPKAQSVDTYQPPPGSPPPYDPSKDAKLHQDLQAVAKDQPSWNEFVAANFGAGSDPAASGKLRQDILAGKWSAVLPTPQLESAATLGGNLSAYSPTTNSIYMNASIPTAQQSDAYRDELGHAFEATLHPGSSTYTGDSGLAMLHNLQSLDAQGGDVGKLISGGLAQNTDFSADPSAILTVPTSTGQQQVSARFDTGSNYIPGWSSSSTAGGVSASDIATAQSGLQAAGFQSIGFHGTGSDATATAIINGGFQTTDNPQQPGWNGLYTSPEIDTALGYAGGFNEATGRTTPGAVLQTWIPSSVSIATTTQPLSTWGSGAAAYLAITGHVPPANGLYGVTGPDGTGGNETWLTPQASALAVGIPAPGTVTLDGGGRPQFTFFDTSGAGGGGTSGGSGHGFWSGVGNAFAIGGGAALALGGAVLEVVPGGQGFGTAAVLAGTSIVIHGIKNTRP